MTLRYDLTGQTFGRLKVWSHEGSGSWLTRCECGNEKVVDSQNLRTGGTQSCGCLKNKRRITHGMTHTSIYSSWSMMVQRCTNVYNKNYPNYGGRGIKIEDPRWY
ncbi:MAG: AP2 domain-containing protein, partial [Gammaproteobacteria bacterium]